MPWGSHGVGLCSKAAGTYISDRRSKEHPDRVGIQGRSSTCGDTVICRCVDSVNGTLYDKVDANSEEETGLIYGYLYYYRRYL